MVMSKNQETGYDFFDVKFFDNGLKMVELSCTSCTSCTYPFHFTRQNAFSKFSCRFLNLFFYNLNYNCLDLKNLQEQVKNGILFPKLFRTTNCCGYRFQASEYVIVKI